MNKIRQKKKQCDCATSTHIAHCKIHPLESATSTVGFERKKNEEKKIIQKVLEVSWELNKRLNWNRGI